VASLGQQLTNFVVRGSQRYSLAVSEVPLFKDSATPLPNPLTLEFLLSQGNPLFNSLLGLALPNVIRVRDMPPQTPIVPITADDAAKATFVQWFFILTRGSTSDDSATTVGSVMPSFLRNVIACSLSPFQYKGMLATFDLKKIDPSWARHVTYQGISQEAQNRLGLGVAGYRLLAPFKNLPCMAGAAPNIQAAYNVARAMAMHTPSWDIHPATRTVRFITRFGSLNKNLSNLILDCLSGPDIAALVANRALFQAPVRDVSHLGYQTWNVNWVFDENNNIF
jgi:hypothetical protein